MQNAAIDDQDRRSGDDRRKFSYSEQVPERGSGEDRTIELNIKAKGEISVKSTPGHKQA